MGKEQETSAWRSQLKDRLFKMTRLREQGQVAESDCEQEWQEAQRLIEEKVSVEQAMKRLERLYERERAREANQLGGGQAEAPSR